MASCHRNSWIPALFSILLMIGIILSFVLAYVKNEFRLTVPQISMTAGTQPQSGIFCIFLFVASVVGLICISVRYWSVSDANTEFKRAINFINKISIAFGIIALLGMMGVGAFPLSYPPGDKEWGEWVNVAIKPHQISTNILFGSVNVYCAMHTVLSILQRKREGALICTLRVLLFVFSLTSFILMKIQHPEPGCENCSEDNKNATSAINVTSTVPPVGTLTYKDKVAIAEIFLAACLLIYFFTFSKEFHSISITVVAKRNGKQSATVSDE